MPSIKLSLANKIFNNKDVNHIIRYCNNLNYIIDNINISGFNPSYCKENFDNKNVLIPMVSFCNISIKDVENFMYYGDYGLGFKIEWAKKNQLSPVIYIHENSDFLEFFKDIEKNLLFVNAEVILNSLLQNHNSLSINTEQNTNYYYSSFIKELHKSRIRQIQFSKQCKNAVEFELEFEEFDCKLKSKKTINSYNEREWRYVPKFEDNDWDDIIFEVDDKNKNERFDSFVSLPKPHIKCKYNLSFELSDLRYIIVSSQDEISLIIDVLNKKYGETDVYKKLSTGELSILSKEIIRHDF